MYAVNFTSVYSPLFMKESKPLNDLAQSGGRALSHNIWFT